MKFLPIIKALSILLIGDVLLAGGGGYYMFCRHSMFYDNPLLFMVSVVGILLWLKLQIILIVWACREGFE